MTSDSSGNMTNVDAEGDTQYKVEDGVVVKNEDWNADTAFPEYHDSASYLQKKTQKLKVVKCM
jgi:hypothetical protein